MSAHATLHTISSKSPNILKRPRKIFASSVHVPLQAVTMENSVLGWPVIAMIPGCAVYTWPWLRGEEESFVDSHD